MIPTDPSQIETIAKIVTPFGIGGLLAVFMFLIYRRDMKDAAEKALKASNDRIDAMRRAREQDQRLTESVTEALGRSTEAHERAIEESAQNRQLFLDLRNELMLWRQTTGNRRRGANE